MSPVDSRTSDADVRFPSAECEPIAATTIQKVGFVLGLAAAPGCGMGMDDTIVVMTNFTSGASNSVGSGSDSRTSGDSGTDSNSSTSVASDTNNTSTTDANTATSVSTHGTTGTSTTGETAATTDVVTSGTTDTGQSCLEGGVCVYGFCEKIDGVDQCICDNPCYMGGDSNCYDKCTDTCVDVVRDPLNPDCQPCPPGMFNNGDPNNPQCIDPPGPLTFDTPPGELMFNDTDVGGGVGTPANTHFVHGMINCGDKYGDQELVCFYTPKEPIWACHVLIDLENNAFKNCKLTAYGQTKGGIPGAKSFKNVEITE